MYFKHRTFNTRWGEVCRTKSAFCAGHRALPLCGCEKPSAGRTPELPRELPSPLLILQASSTRGKPWFLPPSRRCGVRQGAGRTRCPGSPQPRVAPRSTPGDRAGARARARAAGSLPVLPALEEVGVFAEHALERRLPPAAASSGRASGHRTGTAAAAPAAQSRGPRAAGHPSASQGAGGRGARRGGAAAATAAAVAAPAAAAVCALGRPLHDRCAPGERVAAEVAARPPPPQLPPPPLQLRAPGPRVAAPIPREMPDSYRRKKRRREKRAGKEASRAGCSCGRPSSRLDQGPAPPSSHFSGKFGAPGPSSSSSSWSLAVAWGPGLGMLLGRAWQTGWVRPTSAPCTLAFCCPGLGS